MSTHVAPLKKKRNGVQNSTDENGGSLSIHGDIVIEVDNVTFRVESDGDSALVSFDRVSSLPKLVDKIRIAFFGAGRKQQFYEDILDRIGVTLYVHNRHFGIMGPNSNALLRRAFYSTMLR